MKGRELMNMVKLAAVTLLTLTVAQVKAQQTNLVQNITIHLSGVTQGPTVTNGNVVTKSVNGVRVSTQHVLQALEDATGGDFSWRARLVLVTPLNGNPASIEVRDGENKVDVTSFFDLHPVSGSVQRVSYNRRLRRSFETDFYIARFALHDGASALSLHFDVSGAAVQHSLNSTDEDDNGRLVLDAAGSGDRDGNLLILQGVISIHGQTLEVVEGGGGVET